MPIVSPSREDPVVGGFSRLIGGPWGGHAVGRTAWWWTPLRVVLVLTVFTSVLGYLQKAPCRTHPWADEYQYTRVCYTDVYALYYAEQLGARLNAAGRTVGRLSVPYRDHPVEYPAVIGGLMWAAAAVTNVVRPNDPHAGAAGQSSDARGRTFFDLTALLLVLGALATTWAVAALAGRRRVWDAAMFALAPAMVLDAFINWDLIAVALTMLGMWAWSRRAPVVAGVLLGLGVATKLYPVLVLVGLLFLAFRAARLREWVHTAAASVVAFVVVYIPAVALSKPFPFPSADCSAAHPLSGWRWFWSLNQVRSADWGSPWLLVQDARGRPLDAVACGHAPVVLNSVVAICTLAVVGATSLLVLTAPRRPRVPQVTFLLIAGFILVNKVDSPQYALWLLPLAILARPRWRAMLVWQASEIVLGVANFYALIHNDNATQGPPTWVYDAAISLRDVILIGFMALVVREVLNPDLDVVRDDDVDDPAGGVLDGAPDRWSWQERRVPAAKSVVTAR